MKVLSDLCFLLLIAETVFAQCPGGWQFISTKCMMCGLEKRAYDTARVECRDAGGNLATILDTVQETFAETCEYGTVTDGVWMGLKAQSTAPDFVWQDGSTYVLPSGITPATAVTTLEHNCFYISTPSTWLKSTAVCTTARYYVCSRNATSCEALVVPKGSNITYSSSSTPYYSGGTATYSCTSGYEMAGGVATRTCQEDGTWSETEPECSLVDCGALEAPANGAVSATSTTYNSVATYSCNTGHTLGSVTPSRTCGANGSWSNSALTCSAMDCGTPAAPENGAVSAPATTYTSMATYSCNSRYDLEGAATRTCMSTGTWSGDEPTCDNTLAIALGASFGGLALIGIIAGLIYFLSRAAPAGPAMPGTPYPRPAPYRRTPGYPRPGRPRGPMAPRGRPVPGRLY